jgi:hypothetical protein
MGAAEKAVAARRARSDHANWHIDCGIIDVVVRREPADCDSEPANEHNQHVRRRWRIVLLRDPDHAERARLQHQQTLKPCIARVMDGMDGESEVVMELLQLARSRPIAPPTLIRSRSIMASR